MSDYIKFDYISRTGNYSCFSSSAADGMQKKRQHSPRSASIFMLSFKAFFGKTFLLCKTCNKMTLWCLHFSVHAKFSFNCHKYWAPSLMKTWCQRVCVCLCVCISMCVFLFLFRFFQTTCPRLLQLVAAVCSLIPAGAVGTRTMWPSSRQAQPISPIYSAVKLQIHTLIRSESRRLKEERRSAFHSPSWI